MDVIGQCDLAATLDQHIAGDFQLRSIARRIQCNDSVINNRTAEVENGTVSRINCGDAVDSNTLKGADAALCCDRAITAEDATSNGRPVQIQRGGTVYRDGSAKVDDCRAEINVEYAIRENLDDIAVEDKDIIQCRATRADLKRSDRSDD